LTETFALELADRNIRVNAVSPGPVITEAYQEMVDVNEEKAREIAASIPLGRLGTPDDIATAVVFLSPDASSWITGQNILVSGGRTQRTVQYQDKKSS
jgi:NAD(P)-dependent dehydrogenase (short-subunit alcohol dehydrogenase family)